LAIFILSYFKGSVSEDFHTKPGISHPFEPCPNTPNCVIHSLEFGRPANQLFQAVRKSLNQMAPYKKEADSQQLQIHSVFRIAVFDFKDDVEITVETIDSENSILHIKSASRSGRGDLGVNRRRVNRIIKLINKNL
jgi:uncharacterized protein (DUF1499 family)